jgi:dTDP-4-amino-4,6-dideoxygalactose transaminase
MMQSLSEPEAWMLAIDGAAPILSAPLQPITAGAMRIGSEEQRALLELLCGDGLSGRRDASSAVQTFESNMARRVGVPHCIALNSGTSALMAALAALGIGSGAQIVMPAFGSIASAAAVAAAGAAPVFAEVDASLCLDPDDVTSKLGPRVRALYVRHVCGAPAHMARLRAVAERHGLHVIEDASEAVGASFESSPVGGIGDVGIFSFDSRRMLTAGEGGALTTVHEGLFRRAFMFHDIDGGARFARPSRELLGFSLRMGGLQAAVLNVQLGRLDRIIENFRRHHAALVTATDGVFREKDISLRVANDEAGDTCATLLFFLPDPARVAVAVGVLNLEGVPARALYVADCPDPTMYCAWLPLFDGSGVHSEDACPATRDLLARAIRVDLSLDLSDEQVERVGAALTKVLTLAT